ncbi:hypothetical protein [Sphingobium ummariense]|uniref:hypothetical protein n=1 Tax=Sphingobium ummariense TaxID=420994 RepID=UPI000405019C|nr:hypothetical protein [Sphingobium ummariense]
MVDPRIFDWLSLHSENFELHHNRHRESATSVKRHLLHRERLGEDMAFETPSAKAECVDRDCLWELSARLSDGRQIHFAGPTLDHCLRTARSVLIPPVAVAA